ncbi:MAG: hypothetical protein ACFCU5_07915 [Pleurocapsa sp.]
MFNRFKILLALVILTLLGVLFFQNQQSLSLKFLCSDINTSCLYQTPKLPLAIWMGIFIFGGVLTNLIWQILHRFSYSTSKTKRYSSDVLYDNEAEKSNQTTRDGDRSTTMSRSTPTKVSAPLTSDWDKSDYQEDWQDRESTKPPTDNSNSTTSEYEIRREPENVTLSGTTYSYKFKEADGKKLSKPDTPNLKKESNSTEPEEDDDDWV